MAITQGRSTGRKERTKTMTSDSLAKPKQVSKATETPTVYVKNRPQVDILDTGLEDATWHYVWVNKDDTVTLSSYYNDGYRFVKYEDVKDRFKQDEMRQFLYTEDVNGWVSYGDQNRLMKIPQEVYRKRIDAALSGTVFNAAQKTRQVFEATMEDNKYAGNLPKGVQVSADSDAGQTETITLEGGDK